MIFCYFCTTYMQNEDLIKQADLQQISAKGMKIYDKIKAQFEPHDNGKFLAIDIQSGKSYVATSSSDAVELARRAHPNTVFYVVKIGHSTAETLASLAAE